MAGSYSHPRGSRAGFQYRQAFFLSSAVVAKATAFFEVPMMADFAMCTAPGCRHAPVCRRHERSGTVPDRMYQTYFDGSAREGWTAGGCRFLDPVVRITGQQGIYGGRTLP